MMISWWLLWIVFMFVFIVPPVGYGWGYRRWGPPYLRHIQRRRGLRASARGELAASDHHAWGWGGDLVWMLVFVWVFWACMALWWH